MSERETSMRCLCAVYIVKVNVRACECSITKKYDLLLLLDFYLTEIVVIVHPGKVRLLDRRFGRGYSTGH